MGMQGAVTLAMDRLLGRMPPASKRLVGSTSQLGWRSVHAAILEGCFADPFDYSAPFPVVKFNLKGAASVEWRREGRLTRLPFQPGEFLVMAPGEGQTLRSTGSNVGCSVFLDPARLRALAEQEWAIDGDRLVVHEAYHRNAEIWSVGQRLAALIESPVPGGRLFAETLVTQLHIQVLWNYSNLPRSAARDAECLSDQRLRGVIDYLHASYGDEVSLDDLAKVAGLSPNYFLQSFRESTGQTPHRYLTAIRINKACELLQDPNRSIVDISLAVGFSSQSHLTTVFRRFKKTTPAAYREEILGLRIPADRKNRHHRDVRF